MSWLRIVIVVFKLLCPEKPWKCIQAQVEGFINNSVILCYREKSQKLLIQQDSLARSASNLSDLIYVEGDPNYKSYLIPQSSSYLIFFSAFIW